MLQLSRVYQCYHSVPLSCVTAASRGFPATAGYSCEKVHSTLAANRTWSIGVTLSHFVLTADQQQRYMYNELLANFFDINFVKLAFRYRQSNIHRMPLCSHSVKHQQRPCIGASLPIAAKVGLHLCEDDSVVSRPSSCPSVRLSVSLYRL